MLRLMDSLTAMRVEPCGEFRPAFKLCEMFESAQVGLLHEVFAF